MAFDAKKLGHSISGDVRRPLYWNLFTGAFGHTYGHHSVWQMWTPERKPINNPLMAVLDRLLAGTAAGRRRDLPAEAGSHACNLVAFRPLAIGS